ncbi:MAG TPA: hypothetical protein VF159_05175 [Gemmatimonadaceae bacterium]|nr:hypothetical protein [Vicinamibacterales bacterium]
MMRVWALAACVCCLAAPAAGQVLPSKPVELAEGTVTVGGEVVGTVGADDDRAFFNYTDYEQNALRMIRLALSAAWRPSDRVAVLGELRTEDFSHLTPYALYVRVRPWRHLAIQAGRIPPVFGAFGRRAYGYDNPLIGYPLAYQYLTSLRPDAIPASVDDLLLMRGRGWLAHYPIGAQTEDTGVPLVSAYRWDTGVEVHWDSELVEAGVAITSGTLSNPRVDDDNGGRQVSGRVAWRPTVGLVLGVSAARGEWLDGSIKDSLSPALRDESYPQAAWGFDGEYSRDHWLVRGEIVSSRWTLPAIDAPRLDEPLRATGAYVEGRYRLTPRVFIAARTDRLGFSTVHGTLGSETWDAPVTRLEAGGGYFFQRNLVGRLVVQSNWRDGGRVEQRTYVSGQLSYWF